MAVKLCNVCNTRRPKTGSKGTETSPHSDMCNYCYEEGGWENTHGDANHASIAAEVEDKGGDPATYLSEHDLAEYETFMPGCWLCHPELNLAQKPKGASTGTKTQGFRRPQLNHKGHSHPQTPAARRACKLAFWAEMAKSGIGWDTITESAFAGWNYECDGFGKPLPAPAPKAAKVHLAPMGTTPAQVQAKVNKINAKAKGK